jgi:60 kDa SS-A/Ro ribonucleoprotein
VSAVNTYRNAVEEREAIANGLVRTNQGGKAYELDLLGRVRRFLILGTEGNTLYASEQKRTKENMDWIKDAFDQYGDKVVDLIVDVSDQGLAPKNDPALVALAMALSYKNENDLRRQEEVRQAAYFAIPKVARIGTHLFHLVEYVNGMRGWGSGLRNAVASWYETKSPMALANQVTKYQQRDGWSHRDVLRKAHPRVNGVKNDILRYVVSGTVGEGDHEAIRYLEAVERVKRSDNTAEIVQLIGEYNLPREVLPTQALNDAEVWDALLRSGKGMPIHALLRNLGNLAKHGVLKQNSDGARYVLDRLSDSDALRSARVHPIDALKAKLVYGYGRGMLGDGSWPVNRNITDALEDAFYGTFKFIEPTGKRGVLGLDVSGSMSMGTVGGIIGFTPCMASAAMAMVTARVEREYAILGFADGVTHLDITAKDTLESAMRKALRHNFGGTNHAALFDFAKRQKFPSDYFIVYTDNETGYGDTGKAIREYRRSMQIHDAKVITVGMVANRFTIADPKDRNMLDVVGFSTDVPSLMSEFIRGNI